MIDGAQNFHIFSIKSHQSCRMFTHDDLDAVNHVRHENTLFDDPPNPVLNTKQHIQPCPPCSRTLWRHHTAVTLRRAEEVMTLSRPYYPCLIITPGFPSCTCPSTSTVNTGNTVIMRKVTHPLDWKHSPCTDDTNVFEQYSPYMYIFIGT